MSVSEPSITSQEPSPGTRLRQAREGAGLTLAEIAQRTLIPVARLQALEKDDYDQVGVATFVTGYTRTYARIVGLDPAPLVQQLDARLSSQTPAVRQTPSVAMSLEVRKRPGSIFWPLMWLFLGVLVVVAVMGISSLGLLDPPSPVSVPPVSVPPPASAPEPELSIPLEASGIQQQDPAQQLDPIQTTPEVQPDAEEQPLTEVRPSELQEAQDTSPNVPPELLADRDFAVAGTAPPAEAPLPAPAPADRPAELRLLVSDDCWVDVTDATGKRIVARNTASGDNLRLFGQAPFDVILGNASAVTMTLNGRPVDTTPQPGRRMLRLSVAE